MKVFLGADHRGYELKELLKEWLIKNGYEVVDVGADMLEPDDDYVDFARAVVGGMGEDDRGVLLCGSGHGMDMVANRYGHIRSIVGFNTEVVVQGRQHEDANLLVIAADWVDEGEAMERLRLFLETDFSGEERHLRRLQKLGELK